MPLLKVSNIACRYDDELVFDSLSFHVNRGEIVSLLGPSGCGKTTALRAVAGFEPIYQGEIRLNGHLIATPDSSLAPEKRRIGMVFQDYALFPHLNVADNIAFGLRDLGKSAQQEKVQHMLDAAGLKGLEQRFPHEISGGQQQRVALARALAPHPDLLLMDEPFSNLDVELRERLSLEVRNILKQEGITGILVTHDQHEAFAISDKIGVMHQGRILQWDTPYNLYHEPAHRFVADFVGQGSFIRARVLEPDLFDTELGQLRANRAYTFEPGSSVEILLRPDDIVPDKNGDIQATIVERAFKGAEILYTLALATGQTLLSLFPSHCNHQVGEKVTVRAAADHLICFPLADSEADYSLLTGHQSY
ncbi:MAG: ABC transporter ATP-binding protein [Chromatiales bacterium]|jgi:iron(III) transport system ATP-binding protein